MDIAARCVLPNGKRQPHQHRIPPTSLAEARARLLAADLHSCHSFDELHTILNATICDIHMIGALVVYDLAHRIGAFCRLEPQRVYVHRGTRDGALALGLGRGRESIELAELPEAFQRLSAAEAEDCLASTRRDWARGSARQLSAGVGDLIGEGEAPGSFQEP